MQAKAFGLGAVHGEPQFMEKVGQGFTLNRDRRTPIGPRRNGISQNSRIDDEMDGVALIGLASIKFVDERRRVCDEIGFGIVASGGVPTNNYLLLEKQ